MFTKEETIREFLKRWLETKGYPPTIREIGKGVNLKSTKAVKYHLDNLVQKGLLKRRPYKARTLEIREQEAESKEEGALPLLGRVPAGAPLLAVENIEDYISLDRFENCFLLRVKGDSMRGAGILDNDLVIVRPQKTAESGDIVVALIGEEATVKRFRKEKGKIILKPENPLFAPLVLKEVAIIGIVLGVLRIYR